jgi:hypothetical protein
MHIDHLGSVKNLNTRILKTDALQFGLDRWGVPDQDQFLNLGLRFKR